MLAIVYSVIKLEYLFLVVQLEPFLKKKKLA